MDGPGIIALARSVIRDDIRALEQVEADLGEGFPDAVELLASVEGKVFVAGMGTSGATAKRIAHLLSCGGTMSLFVHPADGLHGGVGAVGPGDAVIGISKGGESDELNEFCRLAGARGARTLALTAEADSTLAGVCDQVLLVRTPDDTDPGSMMAMGSALAACAVGDALAIVLMRLRGYPWERFEQTHPGGAVGKMIAERD